MKPYYMSTRITGYTPCPVMLPEMNHRNWWPSISSKMVPLYESSANGDFVEVGETKVWGYSSLHEAAICYRFKTDTRASATDIYSKISGHLLRIRKSFGATYSVANFVRKNGDYITCMYSKSAGDAVSVDHGRHIALDCHGPSTARALYSNLDGGMSNISTMDIEWADGISYVRASCYDVEPGEVWKGYCIEKGLDDVTHLTSPGSVLPGLFQFLTDEEFEAIGGKGSIVTHSGNIKLGHKSDFTGMLYLYQCSFDVSNDGYQNLSYEIIRTFLNEDGQYLVDNGYTHNLKWVKYILEDRSGARALEELTSLVVGDVPETWGAAMNRLAANAPMTGVGFGKCVFSIAGSNMAIKILGVRGWVIPDITLKRGTIKVPYSPHMVVGNLTTVIRYPLLSHEAKNLEIVGYTTNGCIQIHPEDKTAAMDFDGDAVQCTAVPIIDDNIPYDVSPTKEKTKVECTSRQSVARVIYAKVNMGVYDSMLDSVHVARKQGVPTATDALHIVMGALQSVVDSMKHGTDPMSVAEVSKVVFKNTGIRLGDYSLDPMYKMFRGKIRDAKSFIQVLNGYQDMYSGKVIPGTANQVWKDIFGNVRVTDDSGDTYFVESRRNTLRPAYTRRLQDVLGFTPQAMGLQKTYGSKEDPSSFLGLLLSDKVNDAFTMWNKTIDELKANPDADKIILNLWINCVLQNVDTNNKKYTKSLNLFSSLPLVIGKWNFKKAVDSARRGDIGYYNLWVNYEPKKAGNK